MRILILIFSLFLLFVGCSERIIERIIIVSDRDGSTEDGLTLPLIHSGWYVFTESPVSTTASFSGGLMEIVVERNIVNEGACERSDPFGGWVCGGPCEMPYRACDHFDHMLRIIPDSNTIYYTTSAYSYELIVDRVDERGNLYGTGSNVDGPISFMLEYLGTTRP